MATGGGWARSQVGGSDFVYDFPCTPCSKDGKNKDADYQCVECQTYFCQRCVDFHNKFLTSHTLLDKTAMKSGVSQKQQSETSSDGSAQTILCEEHPGEAIKLYCGHHDLVCCSVCIALKHRSCEDVDFIPTIAKGLLKRCDQQQTKAALEDITHELQKVLSKRKKSLSTLNKQRADIAKDIKELKKRLIKRLEEMESKSIEIVDSKHRQTVGRINVDIASIEETLKMVTLQLNKIKQGSSDSETKTFIDIKQSQTKISDTTDILQQLVHEQDESIVYDLNTGVESILHDIDSLVLIQDGKTRPATPYTATFIGSHDISIESDKHGFHVYGCLQLDGNQIIISDHYNDKIKLLDAQFKVTDWIKIAGGPNKLCQTSKAEVAVTLFQAKKVQFLSVGRKLTLTRSFPVDGSCRGISFCQGELYICCGGGLSEGPPQVKVCDMSGKELRVIQYDKAGQAIFSKPRAVALDLSHGRWFVADTEKGVFTLDKNTDQCINIIDPSLGKVTGLCTDNRGNVFVCGEGGISQMDRKGNVLGILLTKTDGIKLPLSVTYLRNPDRLLITQDFPSVIKIYELK